MINLVTKTTVAQVSDSSQHAGHLNRVATQGITSILRLETCATIKEWPSMCLTFSAGALPPQRSSIVLDSSKLAYIRTSIHTTSKFFQSC